MDGGRDKTASRAEDSHRCVERGRGRGQRPEDGCHGCGLSKEDRHRDTEQ